MVFRVQFHTCAVHDLGIVFGKDELDETFKGGSWVSVWADLLRALLGSDDHHHAGGSDARLIYWRMFLRVGKRVNIV